MHTIEFKGFTGVLKFLGILVALSIVVIGFPSVFMMTLWNAMVFEGIGGPEINLFQGFLLWLMTLLTIQLVLRPQIQLQFKQFKNENK